ncbi:DsbC family protein [Hydrogenophaga sp.]|uniref:DsbC family protein n=1 Tax=Hydrogenophaga sp. TaxID=1904254 RepID=UPI0019B2C191|nr:DsbC family protein [Hydrogenophaga sp.]MBD3893533.1 DsbC family protein [Hydrogenophaga sp.]
MSITYLRTILLTLLLTLSLGALAQEATIRKNLAERLPHLPRIDAVSPTPMEGLFEVRVNQSEIFYTDAQGNFLIEGALIDTRARVNLTEQRQQQLSAIDFKDLPLRDAFTIVRGNGQRQLAVFQDPNCGFCKRFEHELLQINNVTIHVFLYPILGPDSMQKSRQIWCSRERARTFQDWMLRNAAPAAAPARCDSAALQRNVEFGRQHRISGTPTTFLLDGRRVPGAASAAQIEQLLTQARP